MEEVPRRTSLVPLAFPCFALRLIGLEAKNVLDYQGRAGDHFHCTVERSPGHIRCRSFGGGVPKDRRTQEGCGGLGGENPKQRSRRRGQFSSSRFPCRKIGEEFPAAPKFAGKPFQQGISDSHSLLEFSEKDPPVPKKKLRRVNSAQAVKFGTEIRKRYGDCSGMLVFPRIATRAAIYRSLRALRARNRKKISKKVFPGVGRKVPKNTRKSLKIPIFGPFWVFLDFFGLFLGLFCRPPKRPFWRLFCDFGPGGPGDSCKWRLGSQPKEQKQKMVWIIKNYAMAKYYGLQGGSIFSTEGFFGQVLWFKMQLPLPQGLF